MAILSRVSRKYDVAVVITNQIYSKFNKEGEELISAVGGTVLKYWSKVIIELEKGDIIYITDNGIRKSDINQSLAPQYG